MKKIGYFPLFLFLVLHWGCRQNVGPSVLQPTVVETPQAVERVQTEPAADLESVATPPVSAPIVPEKIEPVPPIEKPVEKIEPVPASQTGAANLSFEDLRAMAVDHQVQSGESLSEIAAKYDIGIGLVMRLNSLQDSNKIRAGQRLRVIQGPFRIVIFKKDKTLSVYLGDKHVKTYDVAVGKSDSTPEGLFKIMDKMVKPVWTDPYSRRVVKSDDPQYPLGTRWLGFAEYGYGIHGTNDPASIKTEASFGCIRMLNPDVEELYEWMTIGSEVAVVL